MTNSCLQLHSVWIRYKFLFNSSKILVKYLFLQILTQAIGILIVVAIVNYYLVIPAIVLMVLTVKVRGIYIKSARDIKRFEGLSESIIEFKLKKYLIKIWCLPNSSQSCIFTREHNTQWLSECQGFWCSKCFREPVLSLSEWSQRDVVFIRLFVRNSRFSHGLDLCRIYRNDCICTHDFSWRYVCTVSKIVLNY